MAIEILNRLKLVLHITGVGSLIRSFHMDVHKVMRFQGSKCRLALAELIGIDIAGGTFNVDDIQAGTDADPLDQINR